MTSEFVWPPARTDVRSRLPVVPDPGSDVHIEVKAEPRGGWWRSIERTWLCPTSPPVAERLAESGWVAEDPGACCDRCGTTVGSGEADEFGCASCRDRRVPWDRAFRLGAYEGELRAVILEVKFTRFRAAGTALGRLLGESIGASVPGVDPASIVVVPIPMSRRRRVARGIDHTAAIGRGVAQGLGAPVCLALSRRHRPSQRSVAMGKRAGNVAGTMRLRRGAGVRLKGRTVVLVDDVRTSGATLRAAARAIREGGARAKPEALWVATVGVTPGRGRMDLAGLANTRAEP